ncbi:MAG: hypothetical protein WDA02_07550 [Saccharofermentanales bacterium]
MIFYKKYLNFFNSSYTIKYTIIFTLCDRKVLFDQNGTITKDFKKLISLIFKYIENSPNVKAENLTPLEMSKISNTYKKISKYRAGGLNAVETKKMYNDMVNELIEQI